MKTLKTTRAILMYLIATIVLIFGTIVLIYFAQGYSYDIKSGQIQNSGLLLLDSSPNGATIKLNDKVINDKTPYRYDNARPGDIHIELSKPGYRSWTSTQQVIGAEVTFVEYPLLLPEVLSRQSVLQPTLLSSMSVSDNNKRGVSISADKKALYNINENGATNKIYDSGESIIETAKISPDGQHSLIRQKSSDGSVSQFIISTNGSKIINLTAEFGFVFNNIEFNPQNSTELFWLDNGLLRKIDTNSHSISSALLTGVVSYSLSRDKIIATTAGDLADTSSLITTTNLSGSDKRNVASMPADRLGYSALVVYSRYHSYMLVRSNSAPNALYSIYEPDQKNVIPLKLNDNVTLFSSSPNQKFITYFNKTGLHSIDLETNRTYDHTIDTKDINAIQWLDDYHIILHEGQFGSLIDFDGYNRNTIVVNSNFSFIIPPNSKSLFYIKTNGGIEKLYLEAK